jgi:predicted DCC family thiol-disulfide oxidoreductase YuxK
MGSNLVSATPEATILFDGVCALCNGFVRFVAARDPARRFAFAAIQSDAGRALLSAYGVAAAPGDPSSIVVIAEGRARRQSDAVLYVAGKLRGVVRLAAVFRVVPAAIRDAVYALVARYRYRWFGRLDACPLPTPELRDRFRDAD